MSGIAVVFKLWSFKKISYRFTLQKEAKKIREKIYPRIRKYLSILCMGLVSAAERACWWKRVGSALVGGKRTPWWTEDVSPAVKEKKMAYQAWFGNPSPTSRQVYEDKRN